MFRKKKLLKLKLLLFFLILFIIHNKNAIIARSLTDDELLAVKNNGVVSAMCYVNNLLTGNIAKSIMALSIIGIGWLFLSGGTDWKIVLLFSIATSLVFGGLELANIISGNNYSCKSFEEATERNDSIIYNQGACRIIDIKDNYSSGQLWKKCYSNSTIANSEDFNNYCTEEVNDSTEINGNDRVVLTECQKGYLKIDENKYLNYVCNVEESKGVGEFIADPSNDKENSSCVKACSLQEMQTYTEAFGIRLAYDENNEPKIIKSKEGYTGRFDSANNGYFSQGTRIEANCKSGYIIDFSNGNNGCLSEKEINFYCDENGIFSIEKRCEKGCEINNAKYENVSTWVEKIRNKCLPDTIEETTYMSGDKINVEK